MLSRVAPGPYGSLFALAWIYLQDIPTSYQIKILGITFSDHVFFCILAFQVSTFNQFLISSSIHSIVPGITGLFTGFLLTTIQPLKNWRLPQSLCNWCKTWCLPLIASKMPTNRTQATTPEDLNRPASQEPTTQAATEEDIVMLESMGFPRARVIEALAFTRNDVQSAVAYLLSGMQD